MTRALIVGGGISGPVTAMALHEVGIEVEIHEAYDRDADGVGAYLTLAPNGLRALDIIGLRDIVLGYGFHTPGITFCSGTGKRLGETPAADGILMWTIKRADLYRTLRDEVARRGIRVDYGKRLVGAKHTADGVRARFADGSEADGDVLIGADGLRSRTRSIIDPAAPRPQYLGLLNTGGYASGVSLDGESGRAYMIFGKHCFFCYMLGPNDEIWWFANPPNAAEPSREELAELTGERWRARLLDLLRPDDTPGARIVAASADVMPAWSTYDLPSVPRWHDDRAVIIGDAAHATSPASGQGASMAIEDAIVLAKCLRDVPDVAGALRRYEELRRQRVEQVVRQGRRNGSNKTVGPIGRLLRDAMLPMVFKRQFRAGDPFAWINDYRIEWDERTAEPMP